METSARVPVAVPALEAFDFLAPRVTGGPGGFLTLAGPVLGALVRRSITGDYRRLARVLEDR